MGVGTPVPRKDQGGFHVTDGVTLYDLRHSAGIYWRATGMDPHQQMYMFGWTTMSMINYYCEKLGLKDTRTKAQSYTLDERSAIEKDIAKVDGLGEENKSLRSDLDDMKQKFDEMVKMQKGFMERLAQNSSERNDRERRDDGKPEGSGHRYSFEINYPQT